MLERETRASAGTLLRKLLKLLPGRVFESSRESRAPETRSRNFASLRYNLDDIPSSLSTAARREKGRPRAYPFERENEAKGRGNNGARYTESVPQPPDVSLFNADTEREEDRCAKMTMLFRRGYGIDGSTKSFTLDVQARI